MPERAETIESVFSAIARSGFAARGAFHLREAERVGPLLDVRTIALIGVQGRQGWEAFAASMEVRDGCADPLDRFSRWVIGALAEALGAVALYPFGGPPYWPFQRWAQRAEPVHRSPIGLLVHPVYGLWHSYRGALGFREALDLPAEAPQGPSPCESCPEKPCLRTCPVEAFQPTGYDDAVCMAHLRQAVGADCLGRGCLARRACPVGAAHTHGDAQASFAMRAFLASLALSRGGDCGP
jgi:hypothetical protein